MNIFLEALLWLLLIFLILAPWLVPYLIGVYHGEHFFTTLTATTGKIIGAAGKKKLVKYVDKDGKEQKGEITDGWTYHRAIVPKGFHLVRKDDLDDKEEIEKIPGNSYWDSEHPYLSILAYFGIYYVGFLPIFKVVHYLFSWSQFSHAPGKPDVLLERKEPTNYFNVGVVEYGMNLTGVEIEGNVRVDLPVAVFGRITSPEIFFSQNVAALGQVQSKLHADAETFFRVVKYDDLKTEAVDTNFRNLIMKGVNDDGNGLAGHLRVELGFTIDDIRLRKIGGELSEKLSSAAQAGFIAEKEGKAKVTAQEYEARVVTIAANAEKGRIDTVYGAVEINPERMAIREMEMKERVGQKGNAIIFDNGGLSQDAKSMMVATQPLRQKHEDPVTTTTPEPEPKAPVAEPIPQPKPKHRGKNR